MIGGRVMSCEIALRRMSLDLTNNKSTLAQVMAWCHQATTHYLSQCWPRFMLAYGITRPQWVNHKRITPVIQQCFLFDPKWSQMLLLDLKRKLFWLKFHWYLYLRVRWMKVTGSSTDLVLTGNKSVPEPFMINQLINQSMTPYGITRPQLEQPEPQRSENTLPPSTPWLPILSIHVRSLSFQIKTMF